MTYATRKKAGQVPLMLWVSKECGQALDELTEDCGMTKTAVIEHLVLRGHGAFEDHPEPAEAPPPPPLPEGARDAGFRARQVAPSGSQSELGARILAQGARRSAVVVATGQRSENGRLRRE